MFHRARCPDIYEKSGFRNWSTADGEWWIFLVANIFGDLHPQLEIFVTVTIVLFWKSISSCCEMAGLTKSKSQDFQHPAMFVCPAATIRPSLGVSDRQISLILSLQASGCCDESDEEEDVRQHPPQTFLVSPQGRAGNSGLWSPKIGGWQILWF